MHNTIKSILENFDASKFKELRIFIEPHMKRQVLISIVGFINENRYQYDWDVSEAITDDNHIYLKVYRAPQPIDTLDVDIAYISDK